MKVRYIAASALAAALAVAVSTASAQPSRETGPTASAERITVWLQVDAQSGWPAL